MNKMKPTISVGITILLIAFIYPVIFLKLDSFSLRLWDESMYAMNVHEMLLYDEWIVPLYNGVHDLWNSKPPLFLWTQMAFIKLIGFNELALRLPSAIASTIILCLIFWYSFRKKGFLFATFSFFILLTSYGFVTYHSARTGDADALMGLILFSANLVFIEMIFNGRLKTSNIYLFFSLLVIAFWTKTLQTFLFFPAYLILLAYYKDIRKALITNKHFWIGIVVFVCISGSYLIIRERIQPGYLSIFFGNDAGRFLSKVDDHKESFNYFIEIMMLSRNSFWFILFIAGIVAILHEELKQKVNDRFLFPVVIMAVSYFIAISLSVTKVPWYDVPLYPLMALISANLLHKVFSTFSNRLWISSTVLLLFAFPYFEIYGRSNSNAYTSFEEKNEAKEKYLFKAFKEGQNLDGLKIFHPGYDRSIRFYQTKFEENGQKLTVIKTAKFKAGDKVLFSAMDDTALVRLRKTNAVLLEDSTEFIRLIRVK